MISYDDPLTFTPIGLIKTEVSINMPDTLPIADENKLTNIPRGISK